MPTLNQSSKQSLEKADSTCENVADVADGEEWEDPEAKTIGHVKRPMILTHALMTGLVLIILIAVEGLVISKVSI